MSTVLTLLQDRAEKVATFETQVLAAQSCNEDSLKHQGPALQVTKSKLKRNREKRKQIRKEKPTKKRKKQESLRECDYTNNKIDYSFLVQGVCEENDDEPKF
jgi:hypothetical protein